MTEWSSGDVIANGIRNYYYRTGGDKPPLGLVHGFQDNGLCWTRLARVLQRDYDVIMPDARGHGLSEAPREGYSGEARVADLAGVIEALGLGRIPLIGHSMGASTVGLIAATHPDLVRCAIFEDPPWRSDIGSASAQGLDEMLERWRGWKFGDPIPTLEEVIRYGQTHHPLLRHLEWGPWAESKRQLSPNVLTGFGRRRTPWQEVVAKITCPILLLWADADKNAIVTPEVAEEAATIWQDGKAVHIGGAGHHLRWSQPQEYVEAVTSFLGAL